jgi:F0F1-type ATP synthase gamma subunit
MNAAYRRKRQESITVELLDVVAGYEAMAPARG